MMRDAGLFLAALALLATARSVGAQAADGRPPLQPELRADLLVGDRPALQLGAGLQLALGHYVRLGTVAAAGVTTRRPTGAAPSGRVDLVARFLLDPFRQNRVGLSAGGGLGARLEQGARVTPLLVAVIEGEGRRSGRGWSPAVQLGLGGGVRLGMVLRRGIAGAR